MRPVRLLFNASREANVQPLSHIFERTRQNNQFAALLLETQDGVINFLSLNFVVFAPTIGAQRFFAVKTDAQISGLLACGTFGLNGRWRIICDHCVRRSTAFRTRRSERNAISQ